jgi:hypothetical protein
MKFWLPVCAATICAVALLSAPQDEGSAKRKKGKKVELPHPFYWAAPDPMRGDWQGTPGYVAQIVRLDDKILSQQNLLPQAEDANQYVANIFHKFDQPNDKPIAILHGETSGSEIRFAGDGWTGSIADGHFKAGNSGQSFDLQHVNRVPPTLGAKPPAGAIVLFDGTNFNEWAKMKEKDWLTEDGPAQWHLIGNGAMEVVPRAGSLISHRKFGDMKLHVEFRNVGGPTNSGVYIQDRYESNINEVYGRLDGNPCAGFDNSTPPDARPTIRCSRPVLDWQTLDIDFTAPRFDKAGTRTAAARVTLLFNGTKLYDNRELGPVTLNAARLGEAPTGPIQLQEHGMPVQFRNIWVVEKK